MKLATATLIVACLSGCAVKGTGGKTHHVVFGFGVVTVDSPTNSPVIVTQSRTLGVTLSDAPGVRFNAGYANSTVTQVRTNTQAIIEIRP